MRPCRVRTSEASRSTSAGSVTSTTWTRPAPPSSAMACKGGRPGARRSRPSPPTRRAGRTSREMAPPIPSPPPVTTATRPSRRRFQSSIGGTSSGRCEVMLGHSHVSLGAGFHRRRAARCHRMPDGGIGGAMVPSGVGRTPLAGSPDRRAMSASTTDQEAKRTMTTTQMTDTADPLLDELDSWLSENWDRTSPWPNGGATGPGRLVRPLAAHRCLRPRPVAHRRDPGPAEDQGVGGPRPPGWAGTAAGRPDHRQPRDAPADRHLRP